MVRVWVVPQGLAMGSHTPGLPALHWGLNDVPECSTGLPLHQPVAPEVRARGRGDGVDHNERGGLLEHLRLEGGQAVLVLLPTRRLHHAHARRELLGIDRRRAVRDEHPEQLHEPRRLEGALVVDVQHPRRRAAAIDQRPSRQREAQLRLAHASGTDHLGDTARPEPAAEV